MNNQVKQIIDVQNLEKRFTVKQNIFSQSDIYLRAVDNVSFTLYRGETLGLVGESGSGKTTTGRIILRAINPTGGQIHYYHKDGNITEITALQREELRRFRRHMQMIFQDPQSSLSPRMIVRDIIGEPLIVNDMAKGSELEDRVKQISIRCGLVEEHLTRYPHAFSGGQRQRIAIARALILHPDFVVCDESVSSLDVSIQAQILNLLRELQEELDLTYLFIAHDLSVVQHICNRVAVMYLGRIVELATTDELYFHPCHPYTEALMSAIPIPDPEKKMTPVFLAGEIPDPTNFPLGCAFNPRCRYVQDICRNERPGLMEVSPTHFTACHLADKLRLKGV